MRRPYDFPPMQKTRDTRVTANQNYVIKDIALAQYGRDEIAIAETEMPG